MSAESVSGGDEVVFESLGKRYTKEEAAKILGVTVMTLQNWRSLKRGPRYIKSGRTVTYPHKYIEEYFNAQARSSTYGQH